MATTRRRQGWKCAVCASPNSANGNVCGTCFAPSGDVTWVASSRNSTSDPVDSPKTLSRIKIERQISRQKNARSLLLHAVCSRWAHYCKNLIQGLTIYSCSGRANCWWKNLQKKMKRAYAPWLSFCAPWYWDFSSCLTYVTSPLVCAGHFGKSARSCLSTGSWSCKDCSQYCSAAVSSNDVVDILAGVFL